MTAQARAVEKFRAEHPERWKELHDKAQKLYASRQPEAIRQQCRNWREKLRKRVLAAYGGKCVCCGETEDSFLSIDHIDGDGNKHRRELGKNGHQSNSTRF